MDQNTRKLGIPDSIIDDINRDVLRTQKMLSEAFKSYPFQDIAKMSEKINELAKNVTINLQPALKRFAESQEFYKKIIESIPRIEIPSLPITEPTFYRESAPLSPITKTELKAAEPKERTLTEAELLVIAKQLISLSAEREIKIKKWDTKHKFPFQLSETTKWESITIRFLNGHDVQITAGGFTHNTNYNGMGFEDNRKSMPNKQWDLLKSFSDHSGETSMDSGDFDPKIKKKKQLLSDGLKKYFRLDSDPFYQYRKERLYRIKINLISELQSGNSATDNYLDDVSNNLTDELGIWDDYKEKAKEIFDPKELR